MECKEVILTSRMSDDDVGVDATYSICEQDKVAKIKIGKDLRRAIIALRSVPVVSWSADALHGKVFTEDNVSEEYIWKAKCFDQHPKCSFHTYSTDMETVRLNDGSKRLLETKSCIQVGNGNGNKQLEITQRGSSAVSDQSRDITLNGRSACMDAEQNTTILHMPRDPRDKDINSIYAKTQSGKVNHHSVAAKKLTTTKVSPSYLNSGKYEKDGHMGKHKVEELRKTSNSEYSSTDDEDISDIYERSLEILEKDVVDGKLECLSPRSDSPESLMEEALESIPAEEFDVVPPNLHKNTVINVNRETAISKNLVNFENVRDRSRTGEILNIESPSEIKPKNVEMMTFMITGIRKSENETSGKTVKDAQVKNTGVQLIAGKKDDSYPSGMNTGRQSCLRPATLLPPKLRLHQTTTEANVASPNEIRDKELTPEEIFEEIMDSMEASGGGSSQDGVNWSNRRSIAKKLEAEENEHKELDDRSACDYKLENEWLSVYYSRLEAGISPHVIKQTGSEPNQTIPVNNKTSGRILQHESKEREINAEERSTILCRSEHPAFPFQETKAATISQETILCTVKRKPVPPLPLKETVQSGTWVKKGTLIYDFKRAPIDRQITNPQTTTQDDLAQDRPQSGTNRLSVNKTPTSDQTPAATPDQSETGTTGHSLPESQTIVSRKETNRHEVNLGNRSPGPKRDSPFSKETKHPEFTVTVEDIELSSCDDNLEENTDLDLDAEFCRNLEACTASDVDCQSIDRLLNSESNFPSDVRVVGRRKKLTIEKTKAPRKVNVLLGKKKLKKVVDSKSSVKVSGEDSSRSKSNVNVPIEDSSRSKSIINVPIEDRSRSRDERSQENTQKESGFQYSGETFPDVLQDTTWDRKLREKPEEGSEEIITPVQYDSVTDGILCDVNKNSKDHGYDVTDSVDIVEKEKDKLEVKVMSEEVTSQEVVLKISWPGLPGIETPQRTKAGRPPFREIRLQRVMRISDLDDQQSPSSAPAISDFEKNLEPPRFAQAPSPNNESDSADRRGDAATVEVRDGNTKTVARTNNNAAIEIEYENQKNSHKLERVSDSTIDVYQKDTLKVLRVPKTAIHTVDGLKEVVEAVGKTILDDFDRLANKRNIRVTCEAMETKSHSSLRDQDVTIIRNTILDTLGPNQAPYLLVTDIN